MKKKNNKKSVLWTIGLSILSITLVYFFIRSLYAITGDFFDNNAKTVLIITGSAIILLLVFGFLKIKTIMNKLS